MDPSGYVESPLPNAERIQALRDLVRTIEAELAAARQQLASEEAEGGAA